MSNYPNFKPPVPSDVHAAAHSCPFAAEYLLFEKKVKADAISPRTVLLAEDDEVLCYRDAFEFFSGICRVELLKSGGHGMNDPQSIAIIKDGIQGLIASALANGIYNKND